MCLCWPWLYLTQPEQLLFNESVCPFCLAARKRCNVASELMSQSAKGKSAAVHWHLHTTTHTEQPSTCSWLLIELFQTQGTPSMRDMCVSPTNYPLTPSCHVCIASSLLMLQSEERCWSFIFRSLFLSLVYHPRRAVPSHLAPSLPQASALSPGYHVGERPGLCLPV